MYIYIHLCVCVRVCFKVDTTKNRFRRWPLPISCRIQIQSFKIYQDITGSVQHSAPLLCQKLSPQLSQRGTVGFPLWQVKRGSNDSKLLDKNGYDQESWKKRKCVSSLESWFSVHQNCQTLTHHPAIAPWCPPLLVWTSPAMDHARSSGDVHITMVVSIDYRYRQWEFSPRITPLSYPISINQPDNQNILLEN